MNEEFSVRPGRCRHGKAHEDTLIGKDRRSEMLDEFVVFLNREDARAAAADTGSLEKVELVP